MTTIAYRNGIMASDSDSGRGDYRCAGRSAKIFRVRDGVCGVTGSIAEGMGLVRWLQLAADMGIDAPVLTDAVSVIHIKSDGSADVYEDKGVHHPVFEFMAWGSGMPAALAALYMGASAAEAVEIAMKVDPHTGGDVVTMNISEEQRAAVKLVTK